MKTVSDHLWMETPLQWFRMNSGLSQNYKRHHVNFTHFSFYFQGLLTPLHVWNIITTSFIISRQGRLNFIFFGLYINICLWEMQICFCVCVRVWSGLSGMCHCWCIPCIWTCSSDCSVNGAEDSNFTIITSCFADSVITADLPLLWFNPCSLLWI